MAYDIKGFQKRYDLSNKDMAEICGCSLPTIQKWRSGEVVVSGAATQLLRLLDLSAESNPAKLRDLLGRMNQQLVPGLGVRNDELKELESSVGKVVDRLELMLEAKRKETELAESEARYRSMVESQNNPVCRWLPDTTLTYVNAAYSELYSDFGDRLIGRKWLDFIPKEKRTSLAAIVSDMVRRGEEEIMIHESIDKNGQVRYQEWKDMPVKNARGEVVEFHSIGHDQTELLTCRKELAQLKQTKQLMMDLCPAPVLIFDRKGNFIEMNERFQQDLLKDAGWKALSDMMPNFPSKKFARLLNRLSGKEELGYCMSVGGHALLLKGRLLSAEADPPCYLAMFEELPEQRNPVMQVRLRNEAVVDGKPRLFFIKPETARHVEQSMAELGRTVQVDRIYVFTLDPGEEVFDNVLEWCAEGIPSHIDDLKSIPMSEYPWWINRINKQQWIQIEETSKLPRGAFREMEILEAQGICAVLVAPIVVGGKATGFVGFDQNNRPRIWHDQEIKALQGFKKEIEALLAETPVQD